MKNRYRMASALLTLIFLLTVFVGGVYGWQSLNQSIKNEAQVKGTVYSVTLLKREKLADGTKTDTPLADAVFRLFTSDKKQIGEQYTTDENGKITVKLPKGDYYFEEIDPGTEHTFDVDEDGNEIREYHFTVTEGMTEEKVIEVYNIRSSGNLQVQKVVVNPDPDNPDVDLGPTKGQRHIEFTFTVTFSDGGTYSYYIADGSDPAESERIELASGGTLTLRHGETAVFENIPTGVLYHVSEIPVSGYIVSSNGSRGTIVKGDNKAVFTNTYKPNPDTPGALTVTKEVTGDPGEEVLNNKKFKFTAVIDGEEQEFELKHGESWTLEGLPDGTPYTITEEDYSAEGYVTSVREYSGIITGGVTTTLPFVNRFNPNMTDPGSLKVTKEIVGGEVDAEKEFTFEVTFEGEGAPESPQTFTLKHGEEWVLSDIPAGVTYVVKEKGILGYFPLMTQASGTIIGGEEAAVAFQNKVRPIGDAAVLRITKTLAGDYPQADEEKEFHFTLYEDGEALEDDIVIKPGEVWEQPVDTGKYYEVLEKDYYADGYVQYIGNGSGIIVGDTDVTCTNTYIGKVFVEVSGEKFWDIPEEFGDDVKPESIIVKLMRDDYVVEKKEVTPDAKGEWHYSFIAPKYDADGNRIEYTIVEEPIESFAATYLPTTLDDPKALKKNIDIVNKYIPPIAVDLPGVKKEVKTEDKGFAIPDTHFEFALTGSSGAPMPEDSEGSRKIASVEGSGEAKFGSVVFTHNGTYTYTITELSGGVPGWTYDKSAYSFTVTVTGEEEGQLKVKWTLTKDGKPVDEAKFLNLYAKVAEPDKVIIRGQKEWHHGDNPAEKRPESIIVYVYADKKLVAQRQVTGEDDWKYTFELPKYNEKKDEIKYTIGEAEVESYKTEVKGYNLINTYVSGGGTNKPSDSSGQSGTAQKGPAAKTGDTNHLLLLVVVLLASLACIIAIVLRKRKKD